MHAVSIRSTRLAGCPLLPLSKTSRYVCCDASGSRGVLRDKRGNVGLTEFQNGELSVAAGTEPSCRREQQPQRSGVRLERSRDFALTAVTGVVSC
jgi:hypothetical protein